MAKVYTRVEDHGEYRNVATVDSEGNYCQRNIYGENDEHVLSEVRTTNEIASFHFWKTCGDKTYYIGNIGATRYIITIK